MKTTATFVTILALASLHGCAQLNAAAGARLDAAITNTKTTNDNLAKGVKASICAVPFGAMLRDPDLLTAAGPLCLPKNK